MSGHTIGGILRRPATIASTFAWLVMLAAAVASGRAQATEVAVESVEELRSYTWSFGRDSDTDVDGWPDGWKRYRGRGYPGYVKVFIQPHDASLERKFRAIDTGIVRLWNESKKVLPGLPLPPSTADAMVDRYLRIELDGGQVKLQSPPMPASRMYQYRFSCSVMTQGLRYDSARAELVFQDEDGNDVESHSTPPQSGTRRWAPLKLDLVRPPPGATQMLVRLIVQRGEDGLEDVRGSIGFDNVRIDQFPQLRITTDKSLGVYAYGDPITASAMIMGMSSQASEIEFELLDHDDQQIATRILKATSTRAPNASKRPDTDDGDDATTVESKVTWRLPRLGPGFYRIKASLVGRRVSTLQTQTTIAVVDQIIGGPPHGSFGWTVPGGNDGVAAKEFARWLSDLGVAWVKYPSWLSPEDTAKAEETATIFSKLQDAGIQTVGMLDVPPDDQLPLYSLRGRRDAVAAQLFRDMAIWQPLLEPVMTRLTLKVRTWQLGGDGDYSFMGRPRLRESIRQVATGLQGFGQPIDVAISWPWLEQELPHGEASWQAICRASDPPLGADELDSFLTLREQSFRSDGPRTWLLLDPISADRYDRDARIRDLVLRMATVRSHRVQAAFVSNPRDPDRGLLRPNGRPDELLLPWRTTSRLIGNLRRVGSLRLRSGAENIVFAGSDRAVMLVWSAEPTEERMYLGEKVQTVDVWGRVKHLRTQVDGNQPYQTLKIGPVPKFVIGADPTLLAFRMSVNLDQRQLDSFLGQAQKLSVSFTNPTRTSLVGEMRLTAPETWSIEAPSRSWEVLGGRSASDQFDVVLSNTAQIGRHELPIQFEIETVPPKVITVYRSIDVGPEGLELNVITRLLGNGELRVQLEFTNTSAREQSYECMLFPPPGRQYQRQFISIRPGETVRRDIFWKDGESLVGKRMLLRAAEQDGPRVLNYPIQVRR